MKFLCDNCQTKYSIGDDKVRRKVLKIRCKNCGHIIVVRDPQRSGSGGGGRVTASPRTLDRAFDGAFEGGYERSGQERSTKGSRPAMQVVPSPIAAAHAEHPLERDPEEGATQLVPAPDFASDDEWYLAVDGHQFGPMSFDELCRRVKRGEARSETGDEAYVWRDGFADWVEVGTVPELRSFYVPPPPPPKSRSGIFSVGGALDVSQSPGPPPMIPADNRTPAPARPPAAPPGWAGGGASPQGLPTAPIEASGMWAMPMGDSSVMRPMPAYAEMGAPPGAMVAVPPAAQRTPLLIKIAAAGGILTTLTAVAIFAYLLIQDRKGTAPHSMPTHTAVVATPGPAGGAQATEGPAAAAGEGGQDDMDFPPMELSLSQQKRRAHRRASGNRSGGGRRLSATDQRLMEQYGELPSGSENIPGNVHRHPTSRKARTITGAEVHKLQVQNRRAMQACYNRALKRDYTLKELRADVTLNVGLTGRVKAVHFKGVGNSTLKECLKTNFKRWNFRPLGGTSGTEVTFPLFFRGS